MTIQSIWTAAAMAAKDGTKWSLLHRLIMTIARERQKKADEIAKQPRQRQAKDRGDRQ